MDDAELFRLLTIAIHGPQIFPNPYGETPTIEVEAHKAFVDETGGFHPFSDLYQEDKSVVNSHNYTAYYQTRPSLSDIQEGDKSATSHLVSAGDYHSPTEAVHESYSTLNRGYIDTSLEAPFGSYIESLEDSAFDENLRGFNVAEELSCFHSAPVTPPQGRTEQASVGFPAFVVAPITPPQENSYGAVVSGFDGCIVRYSHLDDISSVISGNSSTPGVLMPRMGAKRSFTQYDDITAKGFEFADILTVDNPDPAWGVAVAPHTSFYLGAFESYATTQAAQKRRKRASNQGSDEHVVELGIPGETNFLLKDGVLVDVPIAQRALKLAQPLRGTKVTTMASIAAREDRKAMRTNPCVMTPVKRKPGRPRKNILPMTPSSGFNREIAETPGSDLKSHIPPYLTPKPSPTPKSVKPRRVSAFEWHDMPIPINNILRRKYDDFKPPLFTPKA